MNTKSVLRKTLLAATIATLTACSGGGDDSTTALTPSAAGTSSGVITGFGSIFINGVEYETDTASIDIDGAALDERELGVGDVCVIEGSVNADGTTGTAVSVKCADELEGYVVDVSALLADGSGTLNVMGQTVTVNLDTVFEGNGVDILTVNDLGVNDVVEVSGFSDGSGMVLATRIELKDVSLGEEDVEIKGLVSNLDETAMTFNIGDLLVDYSAAGEVESTLANGLFVEAKTDGALTGNATDGFVMSASKVELEEGGDMDIEGDEGEEMEIQGLISGIDLEAGTFLFNGQTVEIASLDLDEDFDVTSLTDGMMVTVEGTIGANAEFVVKGMEQEKETESDIEGTVSAITQTSITVTRDGTDITLTVNNDTRMMDDKGDSPKKYFSLVDVVEGETVEVEFYTDDATGENVATQLERKDDALAELAESADAPALEAPAQ